MNSITGSVLGYAEARCDTAGNWQLRVDMEVPSAPRRKPLTVRVVKHYGSSAADCGVCRETARLLRGGMRATITYSTANVRAGRLDLGGVERIAVDVPHYIRPPAR